MCLHTSALLCACRKPDHLAESDPGLPFCFQLKFRTRLPDPESPTKPISTHTWVTHNRMSASSPCPLLHGKETHVQPGREPQDGFQETRRKTSWQNTDRTARAWGRLRKCEGWHKTRKTRYWPLSRGFFPFFTWKSKARWLFCFSFAVISNKQWHHLCEVACPLGGPGQIRWTNECKNAFQVGVVVFCLNLLSHTIL